MTRSRSTKALLLAASAALLPGATAVSVAPAASPTASPTALPAALAAPEAGPQALPPASRLPGFAADLAQQPVILGPSAWGAMTQAAAWDRISRVPQPQLQQARWDYARSLVGAERGAEAFGVLEVMVQDDPDLAMVDSYRLARGAALTLLGRNADAVAALSSSGLAVNPEACAWRLRALAASHLAEQALGQVACARPALRAARPKPFVLAAALSAVEGGQPDKAMEWLQPMPDSDPAANLLRGRAQLLQGHGDEARLRFARVAHSGTMEQRTDAQLSEIEARVAAHTIGMNDALRQLEALRYGWRGDAIEQRALRLTYRLQDARGDIAGALESGAALLRGFGLEGQDATILPALRAKLTAALDPSRNLPLDQAAGLYWDYRDLAPGGAEGDLLSSRLAERLQAAGLYERAADLLDYQLFVRAGDLARGPLSGRVASLYILAGRPDKALEALRKSEDPSFPDAMIGERDRVEAVALSQIGRIDEALAVLDTVPGSTPLQAEILWKHRDWQRYADKSASSLPPPRALDQVGQAVVLRHAISLAMLGHEDALTALHARYAGAFNGLPTAPVFEMLTSHPMGADAGALGRAMAALPSASPAGDLADLIDRAPDVAPVPTKQAKH
ncbi:hypothetical protein EDF56_10543 [Novosphingobium sp. PhB165]|uniref:hypothetical protein n=1 Tax=Novosphingobium sp. PhB165 TaxID=2485105 RepID=UPI00104D7CD1|nr:hypothetical protein [Novosphingobium sp. PhB165]TCM17701.1 hypothetical protein EDF56_10543 [Novosphingobium sp. PhB165]